MQVKQSMKKKLVTFSSIWKHYTLKNSIIINYVKSSVKTIFLHFYILFNNLRNKPDTTTFLTFYFSGFGDDLLLCSAVPEGAIYLSLGKLNQQDFIP